MSYVERHTITVTTAAGAATDYLPRTVGVTGMVAAIHYTKVDFANGVDFTITSEATGETIWTEANVNATASRVPGQATHSTAGVAATYDGTRAVLAPIYLANDRVKIVIAQASGTQTGTFTLVMA